MYARDKAHCVQTPGVIGISNLTGSGKIDPIYCSYLTYFSWSPACRQKKSMVVATIWAAHDRWREEIGASLNGMVRAPLMVKSRATDVW
jgi:hypothetical protein